jgi:hypothetical protein
LVDLAFVSSPKLVFLEEDSFLLLVAAEEEQASEGNHWHATLNAGEQA